MTISKESLIYEIKCDISLIDCGITLLWANGYMTTEECDNFVDKLNEIIKALDKIKRA